MPVNRLNRRAATALATLLALLATAAGAAKAAPLLGGFVEGAQALRINENPALGDGKPGDRSLPRSEARAQITLRDDQERASFFARIDLISDAATDELSELDVREAYVKLYPAGWVEIKAGRQVATWGTGDLIFANDLFAKDWEAFFTGLDDSYLKPPQDLLRLTLYPGGGLNLDLAASPHFTPDALPGGTRLSVYNPFLGEIVGADRAPTIDAPPRDLTHGELFGRLYGQAGSFEWALYGYKGFWPTPQGVAMPTGIPELIYPRLLSTGASLRGPVGSLLAYAEGAAYISQDDTEGDDPLIANSQLRGFAGLEKSMGSNWMIGTQIYAETMLDYESYEAGFTAQGQEPLFDELRSTITARVTKLMLDENLRLSLFGYWGISDEDWHLRPSAAYKVSDAVTWTVGANLTDGEEEHTMFGQFQDNDNVFMRLRYSF